MPVLGQSGFCDRGFQSEEVTKNIEYLSVKLLCIFDTIEERGVDEIVFDMVGPREQQGVQQDTIFIVFMIRDMVRMVRECVGFTSLFTRNMLDGKGETREEFHPASLTIREFRGVAEDFKVLMV